MKTFNEKGFTTLAAVAVMMLLSVFGIGIAHYVTSSHSINFDQLLYDRSFYINQAGLEYAMRKIYESLSPVFPAPGITFSGGTFYIDRAGNIVTVTSNYNGAQVVHQVTSPSHADCTDFDMTDANWNQEDLEHITFRKICLEQTVLDKMVISWTNPGSEGTRKVRVQNNTLYDEPPISSGQVTELADHIIDTNGEQVMNYIRFTHELEGKTMTILFMMGDGSSESYTFNPNDD